LHFAPHALHFMLVSHNCIFVVDLAELKVEQLQEPVPIKGTNPKQEQGKPQCI
jgi:hypothetical protein